MPSPSADVPASRNEPPVPVMPMPPPAADHSGRTWIRLPGTPATVDPNADDAPVRVPVQTLDLITTRAGFHGLEAEWNDLFDRAGRSEQMFQTFNWLWHWTQHFLPFEATALAIVTVRHDGHLVALVPLMTSRRVGVTQLEFMGGPVSQYGDALIDALSDQTTLLVAAIQYALRTTGADVLRLAKVRDDAALVPALTTLSAEVTGSEDAPFADLDRCASYAQYASRFSAKLLKNRRRQARRLEEHGTVGLDWTLSGTTAADAAVTTMVLKRAWLRMRGQLSRALADPRTDHFFADACTDTRRPTGAQVSLLTTGGEIANGAITVTVKGRMALHVLAYGLKFEKCAPGVLHVERLVEHAYDRGITTLDLMAPKHDYKLEWCDGSMRVADYALATSLAGEIYTRVYLKALREGLKTILKTGPRRRDHGVAAARRLVQRLNSTLRQSLAPKKLASKLAHLIAKLPRSRQG